MFTMDKSELVAPEHLGDWMGSRVIIWFKSAMVAKQLKTGVGGEIVRLWR